VNGNNTLNVYSNCIVGTEDGLDSYPEIPATKIPKKIPNTYEKQMRLLEKKKMEIQKLQNISANQELSSCTFKPNLRQTHSYSQTQKKFQVSSDENSQGF
jgi:hypothetical protein